MANICFYLAYLCVKAQFTYIHLENDSGRSSYLHLIQQRIVSTLYWNYVGSEYCWIKLKSNQFINLIYILKWKAFPFLQSITEFYNVLQFKNLSADD